MLENYLNLFSMKEEEDDMRGGCSVMSSPVCVKVLEGDKSILHIPSTKNTYFGAI